MLTLKTTKQLTAKNHPYNHYFFIRFVRLKYRGVHETQIVAAPKKG